MPSCIGVHGLATRSPYGCRCCHRHRWALTPPFHPYLAGFLGRNARLRRSFSVTDARAYARLAVSPVRRPALPGLSSPSGSPSRVPEAAAEPPCLLFGPVFCSRAARFGVAAFRPAGWPGDTAYRESCLFISVSSWPDGCNILSGPFPGQTFPAPLRVCGRCSRSGPS